MRGKTNDRFFFFSEKNKNDALKQTTSNITLEKMGDVMDMDVAVTCVQAQQTLNAEHTLKFKLPDGTIATYVVPFSLIETTLADGSKTHLLKAGPSNTYKSDLKSSINQKAPVMMHSSDKPAFTPSPISPFSFHRNTNIWAPPPPPAKK